MHSGDLPLSPFPETLLDRACDVKWMNDLEDNTQAKQDGGRRLRGPLTSSAACLSPGGRQEGHLTSDLITSHPHNPKVLSQKVDSLINRNPSPPLEWSPEDFLAVFIRNVKGSWCKWLGRLSTATVQLLRYSTNLISPFFFFFFFKVNSRTAGAWELFYQHKLCYFYLA